MDGRHPDLPRPLEPDGAEMRRLVDAAMDRIVPYIESLPAQPASETEGGIEIARTLRQPLPRTGRSLAELLDVLFERAIPKSFNAAGPGYLAYIPGGGLFHSALADLVAGCVNRYMGVFAAAPALSQIEATAVGWLAEIVGYPDSARGIFTSGGSLANFTAVFTARRRTLPEDFLDGVIYTSDQAHHSVRRAAVLAGFPAACVRVLPADSRYRLRADGVAEAIAEDRRRGRRPFLVVASAGTTNTGAVDPLRELAELCRRERLWLHVDAAYGGFFMLTDAGRRAMDGLELADSVTLDPHKSLFLPYGTGALLVRDGAALADAHRLDAEYLPAVPGDADLVDFHALSPELSRPFRGLRVWLPLQLLGIEPFRQALEEKLELARWLAGEVAAIPGLHLLDEPQLTLFPFRLAPRGDDRDAEDRRNRELIERINRRQRVFLTGTRLDDGFALRACVLHLRTHRDRVEEALADIRAAVGELG